MISHKYKCIFIHIPRTAGSLVEKKIIGVDMEHFDLNLKHLNASDAKLLYSDYWDEYFKFSIVRNPFDWLASYCNWTPFKKLYNDDFTKALLAFERSELISDYTKLKHDSQKELQAQIIDEELDYIGRFEDLKTTFKHISQNIGLRIRPSLIKYRKTEGRRHSDYHRYYNSNLQSIVSKKWKEDLERFNYHF